MASFKGLLQGLFGAKRARFSEYRVEAPTDLVAVVREANRRGCDALALPGLGAAAGSLQALGGMERLRALDLSGAQLDDERLGELPAREELEQLVLAGAPLNGSCLVRIGPLPALTHLDLSGTRLVDVAVLALRQYPRLSRLDLSRTRISAAALEPLAALPGLEGLVLDGLGLEEPGRKVFADRTNLVLGAGG